MTTASEMRTDARICREAESLHRVGYDVHIVCVKSSPPARIEGPHLIEVSQPAGGAAVRLLATFAALFAHTVQRSADIYHAHNVHALPAVLLAARLRGARVVYDAHELFSVQHPRGRRGRLTLRQRVENSLERWLAPQSDLRITASEMYATQIAEAVGIEPPIPVPNYPVLEELVGSTVLRRTTGAADDDVVVLYQGGFYLQSRALDVVVRAMRLLPDRYRLVLLGFGAVEDVNVLQGMVRAERLGDRIQFLPAVPHQELHAWTSGADIGVIPFRLGSAAMQLCSPNKLYEYLAAGIPVVSSAADELCQVLSETRAGLTYDYASADDFAAKVLALGSTREQLRKVGARGRAAAEQRYSWQAAERAFISAYQQLRPALRHG